jgi:hypothetical protein
MVKSWCILLGLAVAVLWIVALSNGAVPLWIVWVNGVIALASFAVAGALPDGRPVGRLPVLGPLFISIALFGCWAIILGTRGSGWLAWWNFAFAVAYRVVGFRWHTHEMPAEATEGERFRKSA